MLDRLDRKLRYFEPDAMATVLCAMISPSRGQIRICSAGHLPPIIARPGQPAAEADVTPDLLIGVSTLKRRQVSTLDFPPGAVLCLYTDGLVERRDQPLDVGIARLCAAVTAQDPETACVSVMAAMAGYSPHTDDVALLMLRRTSDEPAGSGSDSSPPADPSRAPDRDVRWSDRHAIVTMPAEIDVTNSSDVSDLLAAVAGESPEVITADMTATTFCDSAGVNALARAYEAGRRRRHRTAPSPGRLTSHPRHPAHWPGPGHAALPRRPAIARHPTGTGLTAGLLPSGDQRRLARGRWRLFHPRSPPLPLRS